MKHFLTYVIVATALVASTGTARAESSEVIIDKMIEAHGGMKNWKEAPSVSFTDAWTSPGSPAPMKSNVIVEQGKRRAYLEYPAFNARIGWDGEKAWSVNWGAPMPPRFIALLNYYFVNLPWLMKDPGVKLDAPGTGTMLDDPTEYITIRVTYEAGTGDTPDDWYVLYIHPETYRLAGCDYVVTYPGLVPDGMDHTPVHLLVFEEFDTVKGLLVPTKYTIYEEGNFYAGCEITEWSFAKPFDASMIEMPEGGVIDESMDG